MHSDPSLLLWMTNGLGIKKIPAWRELTLPPSRDCQSVGHHRQANIDYSQELACLLACLLANILFEMSKYPFINIIFSVNFPQR